ncbi:MAG: 4a-hydroxytetrahydrobiopterin dehydratase [Anaerolineae bacterium]|nr:4a-hydroxytetrahydrobiopterin dehydratase [Anaerolineae bacterium]
MTTPLDDQAIQDQLVNYPGWERDGNSLKRTYKAETYLGGLAMATAIGTVCDGLDHHPDLAIGWKRVDVRFTTHDAGSKITGKDFEAVARVEALGLEAKRG